MLVIMMRMTPCKSSNGWVQILIVNWNKSRGIYVKCGAINLPSVRHLFLLSVHWQRETKKQHPSNHQPWTLIITQSSRNRKWQKKAGYEWTSHNLINLLCKLYACLYGWSSFQSIDGFVWWFQVQWRWRISWPRRWRLLRKLERWHYYIHFTIPNFVYHSCPILH